MNQVVHLITAEEVDKAALQLERKYLDEYSGQQLRDRIAACVDLKNAMLAAIQAK